jgi:hypothetical protein
VFFTQIAEQKAKGVAVGQDGGVTDVALGGVVNDNYFFPLATIIICQ